MIPNKIKVAGIDYHVEEVPVVVIGESTSYAGSCDYENTKIQLLESLPKTRKEQVLVHEILHACFHEAGIHDQDEDLVNRVGAVLYQVLKDNNLTFKQ